MIRGTRLGAVVLVLVLLCQSATVGVAASPTPVDDPESSILLTTTEAVAPEANETNMSDTEQHTRTSPRASASHGADGNVEGDVLRGIYHVNRTPDQVGSVQVTYELVVPDSVGTLTLAPAESYTLLNTSVFTQNPDGTWGWAHPGGGIKTVNFTYIAPMTSGDSYQSTVDTRDWAFVGLSDIYIRTGFTEFSYKTDTRVDFTRELKPVGQGYGAAGEWLYLGPYASGNYTGQIQSYTYVRAAAAEMPVYDTPMLERLSTVGESFDVGAVDPAITVFVLPAPPLRYGGASYSHAFWISDTTDARSATLIHEYVHTRQEYPHPGKDLRWFNEGSADYYAGYFAWKQGDWTDQEFRDYLQSDDTTTVLADVQRESAPASYQKGRHVIAALDGEIRVATDGRRSFEDVIRRLNARNEDEFTLTLDEFKATVENVSGREFDAWFNQYITGEDAPPVPSIDVYSLEATSLDAYAGEDDVIQTAELQEIISQWVSGKLSTSQLQDAISHWATRTPV